MKQQRTKLGAMTLCASALIALLAGCGSDNDNNAPVENQPPVPGTVSAIAVIGEDTSIDVLAEASDPEGDTLVLSEATVVQGAGEVRVEDDLLWLLSDTYGLVQVEYVISDGNGGEARAVADVEVKASMQEYVGTDTCLRCHQDKASFRETGHNYKFTKVENGERPEFPFTTLKGALALYEGVTNSAGTPESWADISYVLGGYQRQAILLDNNGYMINGTKAMFDVLPLGETLGPDRAVPFAAGAGPDGMPYNCGTCHNTGWRDYTSEPGDNRNRNRQDDLIGMEGTFALTGVQCEACHGAGSDHAKSPSKDNITLKAEGRSRADLMALNMAYGEPVACGECHTKAGERHYPTYMTSYDEKFGGDTIGGFVKDYFEEGRNAGDALLGYDPDTGEATGAKRMFHCTECHNPHLSTNFQDKPGHGEALTKTCQSCHPSVEFADGLGAMHGAMAECTDCHMPKNSHLFKIDLSAPSEDPYHYGEDGQYRQPWLRPVQSCKSCHAEDYDDKASRIDKIHK
ncbi:Ig-like domain-containing protein [Ferrimonas balearica]|uniref:Ig-like domain-containing protein n=1 Tax=Ferrimonas balearica TaxID=44012 RepID=UPI001C99D99A|nr:cadherin-like domain-containing protein [Ferrimonas balearica]MBY5920797.1 cadherin-like domain-containing protein [Ferrimonas balearica]MBY5996518.1 cadherin-like domain-containing protein [Ferrimonas balearica]